MAKTKEQPPKGDDNMHINGKQKIVDYTTFNNIETPNSTDSKTNNYTYNVNPVPKKDRWTQPHYYLNMTSQVDIGEQDPVKSFREWDSHYWEKEPYRTIRINREKKGETTNNARVLP
ncbi:MAG: hypothetical protein ACC656_05515 [Candidatus Heimdallarchaeota archaeon]